MKVNRIVANVASQNPAAAKRFYEDVLGLELLMDLDWIATYGSRQRMDVQISFMSQGPRPSPRRRGPTQNGSAW
jgi:catechol 2,3-dioxygenase-like lactoylglutathione lyase family enzyme